MFVHCNAYQWLGFWKPSVTGNHQWINGSYIASNDPNWFYASHPSELGISLGWWYGSSYHSYGLTDMYPYACQLRPSKLYKVSL